MADDVAELKRRVRELETRMDVFEGTRFERLERAVPEGFAEHGASIDLLLKQRGDDRALADQRHAEVMAQFEKLLTRPPQN